MTRFDEKRSEKSYRMKYLDIIAVEILQYVSEVDFSKVSFFSLELACMFQDHMSLRGLIEKSCFTKMFSQWTTDKNA